jgi:hypothetical protein
MLSVAMSFQVAVSVQEGQIYVRGELKQLGIDFHSEQTRPQAICPYCAQQEISESPVYLFWIRGFAVGQHDEAIPEEYFGLASNEVFDNGKHSGRALRVE